MSKYVVVIFPSESQAYDGTRALKELHAEGSLTLYGMAVVAKESDGRISIKEAADSGPLGFGVGALIGGLVGLVGGPVGAMVGMSTGGLIGGIADIADAGVQADFIEAVSHKLTPNKVAVVAEVAEDWVTPLDARMESIGGEVAREWRSDFEDAQIEKSIEQQQAELERLEDEWSHAAAERKAKMKARVDEAQAKLETAAKRADDRMRKVEQEGAAKIKELQLQAAKAGDEAKAKIEQRITAMQADCARRSDLLKQAAGLARQAFAA
jgi:uncharacterized membrane protein